MAHRRPTWTAMPEDKTCVSCGRRIQWRARWKDDWEEVRYCRRRGVSALVRDLEERILAVLSDRAAGATVGPSEVARAAADGDAWEPLVEPVRRAARRLVDRGDVVIVQGGMVVDPSTAKGPIRIRRA